MFGCSRENSLLLNSVVLSELMNGMNGRTFVQVSHVQTKRSTGRQTNCQKNDFKKEMSSEGDGSLRQKSLRRKPSKNKLDEIRLG
jgi:hypothetical protein